MFARSFISLSLLLILPLANSPARAASPFSPAAHWIAFPNDDADKTPEPAPQLRTEFTLDPAHGKIAHASLIITGLGCYDCQINGQSLSDHLLDPGWTNFNKTVLYNSFNVTKWLTSGPNAIGITLGNGPYNVLRIKGRYTKFVHSFGIPKTLAQLDITFADNSRQTFATDNSWKTTRGPITFNHQYGGEDYDARRETPNWTQPHFDDKDWQPAAEVSALGPADQPAKLMLAPQPPDTASQVRFIAGTDSKITEPRPDIYVYDIGQNISGWPLIHVKGHAGAIVKLIPGELLDKDGLVTQRSSGGPMWYSYTLSGLGEEIWQPKFSYYGFRYIQVVGAEPSTPIQGVAATQPANQTPLPSIYVTAQFVHADLPSAGSFSSSSDTLNRIHTLINNAILSNAHSVLTDCPHREKLGWLEQSHLMGHAIMMNWNVHGLYAKIENDIADAQHPDGLIPDIAPEYDHFKDGFLDSPEWGSAGVINPWLVYEFYGDPQPLADHYPTMTRYADYLASKSKDHLLNHGLGDWYDLGPKHPGVAQLTSLSLTSTAVYYQDLVILEKTATLLHKPQDAAAYAALAKSVKAAFNEKFFHTNTAQYEDGSQTANAMPLALNLVPEEKRDAVTQNLIASIRNNHNRITAGDVGFSYVVKALTDADQPDLLYDMATQSDGPGYVDQLRNGATTLTEAWDALPTSSQNHLMLGHIEAWFYRGLAGIQSDPNSPGFSHFFLRPQFPTALTSVVATHQTPHGIIRVTWNRNNSRITCTFIIPPNTTATLTLPNKTEELPPGQYQRTVE